jgi:hypothetical protein
MKKYQLGLLLCVIFLSSSILFNPYFVLGRSGAEFDNIKIYVTAISAISGISLWVLMLSDFFRRVDINSRVLWGLMFLFFSPITAVIYFLKIYFPQERRRNGNSP